MRGLLLTAAVCWLGACGSKDDGTYPCCTSKMQYWVCPDAVTFDVCERLGDATRCVRDDAKDSLCRFDR